VYSGYYIHTHYSESASSSRGVWFIKAFDPLNMQPSATFGIWEAVNDNDIHTPVYSSSSSSRWGADLLGDRCKTRNRISWSMSAYQRESSGRQSHSRIWIWLVDSYIYIKMMMQQKQQPDQ
jgi:hypothetical protein